MTLLRRIQTLNVGAIYYFFELDMSPWGIDDPLRFHCNGYLKEREDGEREFVPKGEMMYKGEPFAFVGIDLEGIKLSNDGKVNAPSLRVMNNINGQQGSLSALLQLYDNLTGARLKFMLTTAEAYEDNIDQEIVQYWWVERKLNEDINLVTFELTSPLDFKKQNVPTRLISDLCTWSLRNEYRGETCGYTGDKYFNKKGEPVDSIVLDDCGGTCHDCILRFGEGEELPFGGYMIPNRTNF